MIGLAAQRAVALWNGAPLWRTVVVAAAVCTVLAVSLPGGQQPVQCPGSVLCPPAPCPGAASCSVPTPARPQEPAATEQRWAQFMGRSAAASAAAPAARRCELLADALPQVQQEDLSYPTTDRMKAFTEATACQNDVRASDQRLADLAAAGQAGQDDGAASTGRLAAAYANLTPLDQARTLPTDRQVLLRAGSRAASRVGDSDRRIAALAQAGATFSAVGPPSAYAGLVAAAQAITPFDRERMDEPAAALLSQAQAAADRLRESDARLGELHAALGLAKTSDEARIRQRLIAAVAEITDFDTGRVPQSFAQEAAEARGLARDYALVELVAEARGFRPDSAAPDQVARLAAMRAALGVVGEASPEQREAFKAADRASVMLADSDRRIAALVAAAGAWQRDPSPATAPQVSAALSAATPFDRARFDRPDREAVEVLEAARQVIELKEGKGAVTLAALKDLPVLVVGGPGDEAAGFVRAFQDALRADGFHLVQNRAGAALSIELAGRLLGGQRVGESTTAHVELALDAVWAYDGRGFRRDKQGQAGGGGSPDAAADAAYRAAADKLHRRFIEALQPPDQGKGQQGP